MEWTVLRCADLARFIGTHRTIGRLIEVFRVAMFHVATQVHRIRDVPCCSTSHTSKPHDRQKACDVADEKQDHRTKRVVGHRCNGLYCPYDLGKNLESHKG